jgi:hypothetical protein
MADTKISALPASTTPLAGTEVLPIVQSGATKQVSVANLTAGRAVSATQMTLTTGNLIVASGQGIDFSATPGAAGATSELFNDYEEGTWTPELSFITPGDLSVSYALRAGTYTKIGNRVVLQCFIQTSAFTFTTSASALIVNGIPFLASSTSPYTNYGAGQFGGIVKVGYTDFSASSDSGLTTAILIYCSGSGVSPDFVSAANTPSGGTITFKFTLVYQV